MMPKDDCKESCRFAMRCQQLLCWTAWKRAGVEALLIAWNFMDAGSCSSFLLRD